MKAEYLNLDAFIQRFHEADRLNKKKRFCWILGAGASVTSGIPAGKAFAKRWFEEIHLAEKTTGESEADFAKRLPDLAKAHEINLVGFSIQKAGDNYSELYDYRFRDDPDAGFAQIEDAMRGKDPGLGYAILAKILAETRHRIVITVNFDNLVADAIAIHTDVFPLVCGHESLARYIELEDARPLIFKLHRDLLLGPMSRASEMEKLQREWLPVLKKLMAEYTPIVIGYDGNDRTLMRFLKDLDSLNGNLFWCHRVGSEPRQEIHDLVHHHRGRLVALNGFDEVMFSIGAPLNCVDPVTTLKSHYDRRAKIYTEQLAAMQDKVKQATPVKNIPPPALSELQKAVAQAVKQAERSPEWWSWELKARSAKSAEEKDAVYKKGIVACPKSPELALNYAVFLSYIQKNYDKADTMFRMALELDPNDADSVCAYAIFLSEVRKNSNEAEAMFRKSLELNPNDAANTCNYAIFLKKIKKDYDKAEMMFRKSLELNPNDAEITRNYAVFLGDIRKTYDKADVMYRKALELDPNSATSAAIYATFLSEEHERKDYDKAETMYRKSLELDPNSAANTCGYAVFLGDIRKDYDKADAMYRKALELDPKDATIARIYAIFLSEEHKQKDYAKADAMYRKALELDPKDIQIVYNYAVFLNKQKNNNKADIMFRRALELDPNDANITRIYALFLGEEHELKDYDKAEAMYRKAIELDPNNANNACGYAVFLFLHRKNTEESEKFLQKALELDPKHTASNGNYAFLLWQVRKDYNRAEAFYQKYVEYGGADPFYYRKYAEFLRTVRKNDKKAKELERHADDLDKKKAK